MVCLFIFFWFGELGLIVVAYLASKNAASALLLRVQPGPCPSRMAGIPSALGIPDLSAKLTASTDIMPGY